MQLQDLFRKRETGARLAALTAYDATFARVFAKAGCDFLLVGDSLGMVVQGADSTMAVSADDVAYHVRCCRAGAPAALIVADLPFGSYEAGPEAAFATACRMLAAGARMVKIEGGKAYAPTVRFLVERGVPVCAHVGLLPQSALLTGYRIQGRSSAEAERIRADAEELSAAGASMIVLELIPAALAEQITAALAERTLTIGIGAGRSCDGQILVMHDVLGIFPKPPKFSKDFMADAGSIAAAAKAFVAAAAAGEFPTDAHIPG